MPELKQYFVDILSATPIAPWGTKKLIELAKSGELEAWRFQQISYGRVHESISDDDLSELLAALNDFEKASSKFPLTCINCVPN